MSDSKPVRIQLLGDLQVDRGEGWRRPPRSRQARALLLRLALEPRPQRRDALCELLFGLASDPRAALRWSLSKLRPLLGDSDGGPLVADREQVHLDVERVSIDLVDIRREVEADELHASSVEALIELDRRLEAGLPTDLDDVGSVDFRLWIGAEREALRGLRRRVISALADRSSLSQADRLRLASQRIGLDPFDDAARVEVLGLTFAQRGRAEASRVFEELRSHHRQEGRSDTALVEAWMALTDPAGDPAASEPMMSRVQPVPDRAIAPEAVEPDPERPVPDKPSLAVLDFETLGTGPDILADGLAADLSSRLAQLPHLFVVARASASRLSGRSLAPATIGRRLGVRYLVTGSTQREGGRVRVTLDLIDAEAESEIFSERYDRPIDDLFTLQDEITGAVVATIEPAIERAEMQRALIQPPESLSAWEAFHRGLWHCFRFTASDNAQAEHWFEQAISQDPYFSRAHAGRSFAHYSRAFLNATPDAEAAIARALEAAQASVGLDGRDAMGYWSLARALFLSRRHDEALVAVDHAIAINPNYAQAHYARGFIGMHAGGEARALQSLDTAETLSPYDPLLFAMRSSRAVSLALQGRYEEALPWAIRGTQEPNAHFHIYAIAAAALELVGRSGEAKNNARLVLNRMPDYSVAIFRRSFPHRDEAKREPILAAMERAGLPRA